MLSATSAFTKMAKSFAKKEDQIAKRNTGMCASLLDTSRKPIRKHYYTILYYIMLSAIAAIILIYHKDIRTSCIYSYMYILVCLL